jgi:hypothetical protein
MLLVPCINFFWHFTNVYDDFPVACLRSNCLSPTSKFHHIIMLLLTPEFTTLLFKAATCSCVNG